MEDLPWAHQPLLLALASLFAAYGPEPPHPRCQQPPDSSSSSSAPRTAPGVTGGGGGGGGGGDSHPAAAFLTEWVTVVDETEVGVGIDIEGGDLSGAGGGITVRDAAEALAPALLRYPPAPAAASGGDAHPAGGSGAGSGARRPDWEEELAAAAVVELILAEHERVLEGMRAEQKRR